MQGDKEYCGLEDYGLVGDMHTSALVSKNGSIDSMCWPVFDSPSIFCRILDKAKGGHFSITPSRGLHNPLSKQRYRPYTNMLETRWIHDEGVINILDYWSDVHGDGRAPSEVAYRAMSPLYAGDQYQVHTAGVEDGTDGKKYQILAEKDGLVCMKADVW